MVRSLAKPGSEIYATLDERKCHLMHMVTGLMDEFFEIELAIDDENLLEEYGDFLFYLVGIYNRFKDDIAQSNQSLTIHEAMGGLNRLVKRHVYYGQDLDCNLLTNVYWNVFVWLVFEVEKRGWTMDQVRKHNMEKLAKRYPNYQYTDERAKERADKSGQD